MYRIALVQNQSEMMHYPYADMRTFIEENTTYEYKLYTSNNISSIISDLAIEQYNAIIFASNAFNDSVIWKTISSSNFLKVFDDFCLNGNGCLVLHQLRIAQTGKKLKFLPGRLCEVGAVARPSTEKATDGELFYSNLTNKHICFLYPNSIDIMKVKNNCINSSNICGIYWHTWDNLKSSEWDVLLYANEDDSIQKILFASTKQYKPYRIILCSIPLDWQNQKDLLSNSIQYIVEKRHTISILTKQESENLDFNYLIEYIRSWNYPLKVYNSDMPLDQLLVNLKNNIHSILILHPEIEIANLPDDVREMLLSSISSGKLKLFRVNYSNNSIMDFSITGREHFSTHLLMSIIPKIQSELIKGYIDGSFWLSIETLKILGEIEIDCKEDIEFQCNLKLNLQNLINEAEKHDREGSYDEVFGITHAYLWLKSKYLGNRDDGTVNTLNWILKKMNEKYINPMTKISTLTEIIELGLGTSDEMECLTELIKEQNINGLSEVEFVNYLNAIILTNDTQVIEKSLTELYSKQNKFDGGWLNIDTTASLLINLLKIRKIIINNSELWARNKERLNKMIFNSMIYIQKNRNDSPNIAYPWNDKASTSVKCILSWILFEDLINVPIQEIKGAIDAYSDSFTNHISTVASIDTIEKIKKENSAILNSINQYRMTEKEISHIRTRDKSIIIVDLILLYILSCILICILLEGTSISVGDMLFDALWSGMSIRLAALGIIISALAALEMISGHKKKENKHE